MKPSRLLLVCSFFMLPASAWAQAGAPTGHPIDAESRRLMTEERSAYIQCRTGKDTPETQAACANEDEARALLEKRGWCWGPDDVSQAEKNWVRCPSATARKSADVPLDVESRRLLELEAQLNSQCRGSYSAQTQAVCAKRDEVFVQLKKRGWCWGPEDAATFEKHWARCSSPAARLTAQQLAQQTAPAVAQPPARPPAPRGWALEPDSLLGIKIGLPLSASMAECPKGKYGLIDHAPGPMCWHAEIISRLIRIENHATPGLNIWSVTVQLVGGNVEGISFKFSYYDHLKMLELLTAKFGPPTSQEQATVQNRSGATFDQLQANWHGANMSLSYFSREGMVNEGLVDLSTRRFVDSLKFDAEKHKGKL
jgi:hypothetical protein